jgi:hypothetical protein
MTNKNIKRPIHKSSFQRVVPMMLTIFAISLACVFILVGVLLVRSSGKPEPFLDEKGRPLAGSI